jgi:uncharacterized membrane protein YhaH (DUF805 family)
MAQILVQRKRKNYWWIWLLLLIIVLGVLFYLYQQGMLGDLNKLKINQPASMIMTSINQTWS